MGALGLNPVLGLACERPVIHYECRLFPRSNRTAGIRAPGDGRRASIFQSAARAYETRMPAALNFLD
jgi:hypothetical protein